MHSRLIDRVRHLAAGWDAANDGEGFPRERLDALAAEGALAAFARLDDPAAVAALFAVLRAVGGADLSLGRILEGHVNAAQLIHALGTGPQRAALARDVDAGRVFGVWNSEPVPGVTGVRQGDGLRLSGVKRFATGAGHIDRALVTVEDPGAGRRLALVDVGAMPGRADNSGWRVRGMRGTMSGVYDFTGLTVAADAMIGGPGDYEREPRFSGGGWRFTAVQLGAVEALLRHWRDHLVAGPKAGEPVQRARFGAAVVATRSAALWAERAALRVEAGAADALPLALMARGVVEDAGLMVMEGAARGMGTTAFFDDSRADRIARDLGLYLRQPASDQVRDRAAAAWLDRDRWGDDRWW